MATEYAGYVSPDKIVDWASLSDKFASKLYDVGAKRTAEKEALDKSARDVESIVNDPSIVGKNETFNNLILDGADRARTNIQDWNKQLKAGALSPKEYKQRLNTLTEYWGTLANSAKTFDQRYTEVLARQQPDENGIVPASEFELELANRFGQMAELQNSKLQFSNDGRVFMTKVDPKTGELIGDITDVRSINSPENIVSNRIVVPAAVENLTKGWDPWVTFKDLGRGGELNIEDIRSNPQFDIMKAKVAETVASDGNPRAQISVLVDNGVMAADYYTSDAEYKQKRADAIAQAKQIKQTAGQPTALTPEELKEIDFNLVKLTKDPAGILQPELTEEQRKAAKDRVMQEVEIQMEKKITGSPKQQWSYGGGGSTDDGGKAADKNQQMIAGYAATLDAFGIDRDAVKQNKIVYTKNYDFSGLDRRYQYKKVPGGVQVWASGTMNGENKYPLMTAKEPKDLAQFAMGGSRPNEATVDYNKARLLYKGSGEPAKETDSKEMTAEELINKYK